MSAKPKQPTTLPVPSPAKALQEQSSTLPDLYREQRFGVTLRTQPGFEYSLELDRDTIEKILDPDVPDVFLEIHGTKRFLHTSYVAEIDVRGL